MTVASQADAALDLAFPPAPAGPVGIAISGGGDSMALLHLAARWAARRGVRLQAVTVDHGLRAASAAEADLAAQAARSLNLPHETLVWHDRPEGGNLSDRARQARRRLIGHWAQRHGIGQVLLGHTLDDQAETVLMRMARGSGVDGLAGMAAVSTAQGLTWHRPLLGIERSALRAWLRAKDIVWTDDPTNDDPAYDRVRARQMSGRLAELGLTPQRLGLLADHMARARIVLVQATRDLAAVAVRQHGPDLLVDRAALLGAPVETRTRLLADGLSWIAGNDYRPRYAALSRLAATLSDGSLHGVLLRREGGQLRLTREAQAVATCRGPPDAVWDGRWRIDGPGDPDCHVSDCHVSDCHVAALGHAGLRHCPASRDSGFPPASLAASPAIWRGDTLVAAPLAGVSAGWRTTLIPGRDHFVPGRPSH